MLASLPPALLAEAQALRERAHRIHRDAIGARRTMARLGTGGGATAGNPFPVPRAFDGVDRDVWMMRAGGNIDIPASSQGGPFARAPDFNQDVDDHPQVGVLWLLSCSSSLHQQCFRLLPILCAWHFWLNGCQYSKCIEMPERMHAHTCTHAHSNFHITGPDWPDHAGPIISPPNPINPHCFTPKHWQHFHAGG